MPKLTVNPDSAATWEIELQPGPNSLGRGEENDFPIEHPSVSSAHCVVTLTDSGVAVKDVGSVNGTFVNNTLVEEAMLMPGQILRLGDVIMRLEDAPGPSAPQTKNAASKPAGARAVCKNHPKASARYFCSHCNEVLCELCVNTRIAGGRQAKFCRACNNECTSTQPEVKRVAPSFTGQIGGAFAYPFKHDGIILLGAGTVFYVLMDFLTHFMFIGGFILYILGTCYLISYMQSILVTSAMGENLMPDWPDFTSLGNLVSPSLQFGGTMLLSFGPLIMVQIFAPTDAAWTDWAQLAALSWGCLCFPIAFTAVSLFDSLGALNPLLFVPSILRILLPYALTVLLVIAIYFAYGFGVDLLQKALPIPVLPEIISVFLSLYLFTVEMRLLGLLYWTKRDKLRWFRT